MKTDIKKLLEIAGAPTDTDDVEKLIAKYSAEYQENAKISKQESAKIFYDGLVAAKEALDKANKVANNMQISRKDLNRLGDAYHVIFMMIRDMNNNSRGKVK